MVGFLLLLTFEILGIGISLFLLKNEYIHINIWLGLLIGLASFMWIPLLFSFIFRFSILSHLLALGSIFIISLIIFLLNKGFRFTYKFNKDVIVKYLLLVMPLTILICILLTSHVLKPLNNGSLAVGQSTYGDLCLHLGIATSIATQGNSPPEYSIFPGQKLCYPFLVDSLSSSLLLFKAPLRSSILIPSYILIFLLVSGFYFLCSCFLKTTRARIISILLFFFNGGFGIFYFLDNIKQDKKSFTKIFTEFYQTPTNLPDKNIKWVNVICDMIIPQRTTMAGWAFAFACIWLLYSAITKKDIIKFLLAGILAGFMPMIHTHSYFALGIISAVWFIVYFMEENSKVQYFKNWLYYGIPALLLSIPQLFYWTFNQSSHQGFVRLHFNWANEKDIWLWFWIKNIGIVLLLLIPALKVATNELKNAYYGAIAIFIIAEIIVFQPNTYDNNKLFYIWYAFTVFIVANFIDILIQKVKKREYAYFIMSSIIFIGTISGALSLCREFVSEYTIFDKESVDCAEFVKNNTLADGVFLTSDNHNNVISSLTGRNIFSGTAAYLAFHGIDYNQRQSITNEIYKSTKMAKDLISKNKIDYIFFSNYEKGQFKTDGNAFDSLYKKIYQTQTISIYAVSDRALLNFTDK